MIIINDDDDNNEQSGESDCFLGIDPTHKKTIGKRLIR